MRILVIADIHSNWSALTALDVSFDHCVVLGDIVDYGTDPVPCVNWVRQYADVCIRGNHDHSVAQRVPAVGTSGFRRLAAATRPLHWERLNPSQMKFLGRLPVTTYHEADQRRFYLVHATPRDPMDEYLGPDPRLWKQRIGDINADIICVGHSHTPFHLEVDGVQILNPGSIGQPRDGDWRGSYAIIEEGKISLHRYEYDLDRCLAQVRDSGVEPWAVELTKLVLSTGGRVTREEMDRIGQE